MIRIIVIILTFSVCKSFAQDYELHRNSLDTLINRISDPEKSLRFGTNNANIALWKTVSGRLENKSDSIYFSNKNNLIKYSRKIVSDSAKLKGEILFFSPYDSVSLRVDYNFVKDTVFPKERYGSTRFKSQKISFIKLNFDNVEHIINPSVFDGFYEVWAIDNYGITKPIEVYTSLNKEYVYMYVYGSGEGGLYLSKLIFSKKGFESKIVVGYFDFLESGGIADKYIGI
jgi:hypothetical protein